MAEMSNRAWVGEALAILANGLGPFVQRHLSMSAADSTDDPSDLLHAMDDRWEIVESQFPRLTRKGIRSLVGTLRHERHRWAHNRPIEHHDAQLVLSGVVKLLEAVDAAAIGEAKQLMEAFNLTTNTGINAQSPLTDVSRGARVRRQGVRASVHAWFIVDSPLGLAFVAHYNGRVSALRVARNGDLASKPETGLRASDWGVVDDNGFVDHLRQALGVDAEQGPDPDRDPKLVTQVSEALATGRTDVPVDLSSFATAPFQREALMAATRIPRGEVRTYKEVAQMAGRPLAHQTAGNAMRRNPVPLLIPCHRVVHEAYRRKRDVGRWGYGRVMKAHLLAGEGVVL